MDALRNTCIVLGWDCAAGSVAPCGKSGTVGRYISHKVLLFTLRSFFHFKGGLNTSVCTINISDGLVAKSEARDKTTLLRRTSRRERDRRTLHLPQGPSIYF